jgi:PhnB protein
LNLTRQAAQLACFRNVVAHLEPGGCTLEPPCNHYAVRNPPAGYTRVSPYLLYEDVDRAIEYLAEVFGFQERLSQVGGSGRKHAELLLGEDGLVMVGQAGDGFSSPRTLGVYPPSLIHVYVDDVEALHARARGAGAEVSEPEMSPAGDRRFTATDLEGQVWVFAQRVETVNS